MSRGNPNWRIDMFRSRIASFAILACAAVVGFGHAVADAARHACMTVARWLEPPVQAAPKMQAQALPVGELAVVRSFLARQMRRARPTVTPRWRMCPSA
ncbi:hypothetical protein N5K37_28420 [Delftia tsuruhatensis]|uniref:hypothetical protein n=1 Tax=Delftia tsuruhatensis TaxID=180282 RepID=UPI00244B8BAB|nr:hypothetical protein [Delftia tsuruhatensis]MDH2233844.1 hypothetical protein [Delftia tsuruhatensis]